MFWSLRSIVPVTPLIQLEMGGLTLKLQSLSPFSKAEWSDTLLPFMELGIRGRSDVMLQFPHLLEVWWKMNGHSNIPGFVSFIAENASKQIYSTCSIWERMKVQKVFFLVVVVQKQLHFFSQVNLVPKVKYGAHWCPCAAD